MNFTRNLEGTAREQVCERLRWRFGQAAVRDLIGILDDT
jgi:hypothetical protein